MMKSIKAELLVGLCSFMCIAAVIHAATPADSKKAASAESKPPARPTRDELPPSKLPLHFMPHERIALVGGSLAERMNLFGNFESLLHTRFPKLRKVCFNGKTSGKFAPVLSAAGYATLVLPSSSAANAILSFDQKLRIWRDILTTQ